MKNSKAILLRRKAKTKVARSRSVDYKGSGGECDFQRKENVKTLFRFYLFHRWSSCTGALVSSERIERRWWEPGKVWRKKMNTLTTFFASWKEYIQPCLVQFFTLYSVYRWLWYRNIKPHTTTPHHAWVPRWWHFWCRLNMCGKNSKNHCGNSLVSNLGKASEQPMGQAHVIYRLNIWKAGTTIWHFTNHSGHYEKQSLHICRCKLRMLFGILA